MSFESLTEKAKELTELGVAKAKEVTELGMAKAKEIAEIGKLKLDVNSQEVAIRRAYQEIGRLYFAERGSAPESPYAVLCEKISSAQDKIAYNHERIADIKAASGLTDDDIPDADYKSDDEE